MGSIKYHSSKRGESQMLFAADMASRKGRSKNPEWFRFRGLSGWTLSDQEDEMLRGYADSSKVTLSQFETFASRILGATSERGGSLLAREKECLRRWEIDWNYEVMTKGRPLQGYYPLVSDLTRWYTTSIVPSMTRRVIAGGIRNLTLQPEVVFCESYFVLMLEVSFIRNLQRLSSDEDLNTCVRVFSDVLMADPAMQDCIVNPVDVFPYVPPQFHPITALYRFRVNVRP